jgi:hypothetical protein
MTAEAKQTISIDLEDPNAWFKLAKCRGLPPSWFVPSTPGGTMEPVKAICFGTHDGIECPVRLTCLNYGEENDLIGCWGGKIRSSQPRRRKVETPSVLAAEAVQDARPRRSLRVTVVT